MIRGRARVRWAVAAWLCFAVVVGSGGRAAAHATLDGTSPPSGSVLEKSPEELRVSFTEAVDLVATSLRLVASDGSEIELGPIDHSDPTAMVAAVPPLGDGTYVVGWRAISADSHPVSGAFSFSVGPAPPASAELLASVLEGGEAPPLAGRVLGIGRWASYLGLAVVVGTLAIVSWLGARGSLTGSLSGGSLSSDGSLSDGSGDVETPGTGRWSAGRVRRVVLCGWVAGVVGTAAMVAAQGSVLRGGGHWFDVGAWSDVVDTRAGLWWVVRLVLLMITGVVVARPEVMHGRRWVALVWSAALMVVTALGGHAVTGRWVALGFVATVVHLVAMTAWVGVLVVLALLVPRSELVSTARRCSPVALTAVALLVASGVLNGVRQVGGIDALTTTGFGKLLVAKVIGVLLVLVLAAESRFVLRSHAETGDNDGPLAALRRTVPGELIGVVAVLALTAALVNRPPGRDDLTGPATATMSLGDRTAQVVVDPATSATPTVLHVTIASPRGSLDVPDDLSLEISHAIQGLGPIEIELTPSGPNHAVAIDAVFPIEGTWSLQVTARYGDFDQAVFKGELEIEG